MNLEFIDTHAHLDMEEFDSDREEVISRAAEAGVKTIINVGIDMASNLKVIEMAEKYPGLYAVLGVHPQDSRLVQPGDIEKISELAAHPKVVAIGETGLDFYREHSPRETQVEVFKKHLEMAGRLNLPVVIHSRAALPETLEILKDWSDSNPLPEGKARGVIHCFNTNHDSAEKYMEMDFYFSLGGYIGYPSSIKFREVIKELPLDRIMLETDCPFLPPQKFRGKRNEPAYSVITAGVIAEIKGITIDQVAGQTTANAVKCFNLGQVC